MVSDKVSWLGTELAVQPRIRLLRSFDERSHGYLGYALRLNGTIDGEDREFTIGIGKAAQAKHEFRCGDVEPGMCVPVPEQAHELVEFYKVSQLKLIERPPVENPAPPPWHGTPPDLPTYRARGHRRLAARTYKAQCTSATKQTVSACTMPSSLAVSRRIQVSSSAASVRRCRARGRASAASAARTA